jgi:hypothetical protein
MKALTKKRSLAGKSVRKSATKQKVSKKNTGFEKAWAFWKTIQLDMSGFTFNRKEANAR